MTTMIALRILVAEDSRVNQRVTLALLSKLGHIAVIANNGKEVLDTLAKGDFDLVLMDIQMPVLDGMQATAAIRASEQESGRHQPIIAVTAQALPGDRERCLTGGMDEYVSKPISKESLCRAIAIALGRPISTDTSASAELNPRSSQKLVDWNSALRQLGGHVADLKAITESYIQETGDNLSRLSTAIAAGNVQESKRLAHTVKGAMRFFHAEAAQQSGLELETLAAAGDLTTASELFKRLTEEVDRVLPVLRHFIDTGEMQ